ncbi:hypothetical protein [Algicella marina]|uniref:DUF995 domain-containing protein n=1 Tax=Algicella marina TaxID=2683284 RepID=A0A6P1T037_9RHOB|nr:hypothetical protein [Algicella marina]QHQ34993.1 hypothetical protein GO499_07175 [Algicella marina]
MKRRYLTMILVLPGHALAEKQLSPGEFEELVSGKTLYFEQNGSPYGAERYRYGRQSTWQYTDGSCVEGQWYAIEDTICFIYENSPFSPQCWIFTNRDGDYFARTVGTQEGAASELIVSREDNEPLDCPGPDLGV